MKKKSKKALSVPLLVVSIVAVLGLAWGINQMLPEPVQIFEVSTLPEGEVVVTGVLSKDTPLEEFGNYFVETSDGSVIALDSSNLNEFVGQTVLVEGNLGYADTGSPYMLNSSVSLAE